MKTKKIAFAGFMASILMASGAAFASEELTALTTKGYVDAGLRAVYGVASAAADQNLSNISSTGAANISAKGTVDLTEENYQTGTIGKTLVDMNSAVTALDSAVSGLDSAISGLGSTVSGLDSAVTALDSAVSGLQSTKANASEVYSKSEADAKFLTSSDLSGADYTSDQDSGITVDNTNRKIKLSVPNGAENDGNTYVYKNGTWSALAIESSWDPSVLTTP